MTQKIKEPDEKGHTIFSVCSHTGTVCSIVEGHVYTNVTETKVWSFEDINAAFDKLAYKIWLHMTPMGIQILAGEN